MPSLREPPREAAVSVAPTAPPPTKPPPAPEAEAGGRVRGVRAEARGALLQSHGTRGLHVASTCHESSCSVACKQGLRLIFLCECVCLCVVFLFHGMACN